MGGGWEIRVSAVSLLLLVAAAPASSETTLCRIEDCPNFRTIRYYEELGCVRSDGSSDCCATRYNCSPLLSLDETKCHYDGKMYEPGGEVLGEVKSLCRIECACHSDAEGYWRGEARFSCGIPACDVFPVPEGKESACYRTYSVDQCCGTGVKCVNDTNNKSLENVKECAYKGKTYLEGQFIEETYSDCITCVCQDGYDGTVKEPWCRRLSCDYSLTWSVSRLQRCAPFFSEFDKCCADDLHCPSAEDSVLHHSESSTANEGYQCSFGNYTLNIGDEILGGTNGCVKCRCDVPPFITCTRRADSECQIYRFSGFFPGAYK